MKFKNLFQLIMWVSAFLKTPSTSESIILIKPDEWREDRHELMETCINFNNTSFKRCEFDVFDKETYESISTVGYVDFGAYDTVENCINIDNSLLAIYRDYKSKDALIFAPTKSDYVKNLHKCKPHDQGMSLRIKGL